MDIVIGGVVAAQHKQWLLFEYLNIQITTDHERREKSLHAILLLTSLSVAVTVWTRRHMENLPQEPANT